MTIQVGKVYRRKNNHDYKVGVVEVKDFLGESNVLYYIFHGKLFIYELSLSSVDTFATLFEETSDEPEVACQNENGVPLIYGKEYAFDNMAHGEEAVLRKVVFLRMIEPGLAEFNVKSKKKANGVNMKIPTSHIFELPESGAISEFIEDDEENEELTWASVKEQLTSLTEADKMYGDLLVSIATIRRDKGWSVEKLSAESGVDVKYIEKVERLDKTLSMDKLLKLAVALDVKIALV